MNRKPARPTPRTLADAPRPLTRTPRPSAQRAIFPSLAAVLAGGAVLPACEDPACGTNRADEITRHGPQGFRAAHNGDGANTLREIGLALGLVSHGSTRVEAAGSVPVTTPEPPIVAAGAVAPVTPDPPQPPPQPQTVPTPRHVEGGPRVVRPQNVAVPGGMRAITPQPTPPPQPDDLIDGSIPHVTPRHTR